MPCRVASSTLAPTHCLVPGEAEKLGVPGCPGCCIFQARGDDGLEVGDVDGSEEGGWMGDVCAMGAGQSLGSHKPLASISGHRCPVCLMGLGPWLILSCEFLGQVAQFPHL